MTQREKTEVNKDIGKRLKRIRKDAGYSQSEIALKIGLKNGKSYSTYETGYAAIPIENLLKLCEILKITPNSLLGFENIDKISYFCKTHDLKYKFLANNDVKLFFPEKESVISSDKLASLIDGLDRALLEMRRNKELPFFEHILSWSSGEEEAERQIIVSNLANKYPDIEIKHSGKTIRKTEYGKEVKDGEK